MGKTCGRREFMHSGTVLAGCVLGCPALWARDGEGQEPTPKAYVFDETMSYCNAECTPERCKWLGDDMEFKREKARELSEKLDRTIRAEEITCSRCRVSEPFEAIVKCPIRECVVSKGLVSCAHCPELEGCERANSKTRERSLAIQRVVLGPRSEAKG